MVERNVKCFSCFLGLLGLFFADGSPARRQHLRRHLLPPDAWHRSTGGTIRLAHDFAHLVILPWQSEKPIVDGQVDQPLRRAPPSNGVNHHTRLTLHQGTGILALVYLVSNTLAGHNCALFCVDSRAIFVLFATKNA